MQRKTTALAATCAAAVMLLSGCRFFGIDTRPDIRYVTEGQRKNVSEPMYSMPVAGTGLFKQWPMRLGADYGFAPWERNPSNAGAAAGAMTVANAATSPAEPSTDNAVAHETNVAAADNRAAAAASASAASTAKPSHRATPRLAGGELAEAASASMNDNTIAGVSDVAANDFDVPAAARGSLDFRPPYSASPASSGSPLNGTPPRAPAAVVARASANAKTDRPPRDEELPWRPTGDELAGEDIGVANGGASTASASSIGLQQPGIFSARKAVANAAPRSQPKPHSASNGNSLRGQSILRDEAVRPAGVTMPIRRPSATPLRTPMRNPERLPSELIPPDDDTLGEALGGMRDELPLPSPQSTSADVPNRLAMTSHAYTDNDDNRSNVVTHNQTRPTVVRPPASYDDDPVFVTASDMEDDGVSVAREYANQYFRPSDSATNGVVQDASRGANAGVLSELEAAKRNILP